MFIEPYRPPTQILINGKWRDSSTGATSQVRNPADGTIMAEVAEASPQDVDDAIHAARFQFDEGEWSKISAADRGHLLWKLAALIEENLPALAALESAEVGRPIGEPLHGEIPLVVDTFRHFAGWADKITGNTFDLPAFDGQQRFSYTRREPLGVIGAITPWNAPTMIASWKIAPSLAAGNTLVIKPAEETPLTTLSLAQLALEAGIPAGVFNVVPGRGSVAGSHLTQHPGVDKVSFTGSTVVGQQIAAAAAPNFAKLSLELGGKNPQIVWPDADLDKVVPAAAFSVFANQGQTCASGSRIYVHRQIAQEFGRKLAEHAKTLRVGDPRDPETQVGTLINQKQFERVTAYIESAHNEGANILAGGNRSGERGHFIEPTVFIGSNQLTIAQEEIFGPVATVVEFDDDDEVLNMANASPYGLTAVLWTDSSTRIQRFTRELQCGVVWVNGWGPPHPAVPWLGVKQSGIGEELGQAGLQAVTRLKTVNLISAAN